MKVKELIKYLEQMDQNRYVMFVAINPHTGGPEYLSADSVYQGFNETGSYVFLESEDYDEQ